MALFCPLALCLIWKCHVFICLFSYINTLFSSINTHNEEVWNNQITTKPPHSCLWRLGHTDQQLTLWPCVCSPSHPCLLLMCVFNLLRVKVHWLQGLGWFWEDGKLQWLDEFGQGVWCAWESSRDFSKILGLLAGRRFLRGPIILPWVEFKSRDQSSSFVWQGAATSATWRCLWWRDR